ncbi:MAG TPA: hypothetical protein ENK68_00975 [Epsilonproteobacteria bacterium]|nr:hypothetical protein [Campylobacterota bacterium]
MLEYLDAILWYCMWPVVVYASYRFVVFNLQHHAKMELLEKLEKNYIEEHGSLDEMYKGIYYD